MNALLWRPVCAYVTSMSWHPRMLVLSHLAKISYIPQKWDRPLFLYISNTAHRCCAYSKSSLIRTAREGKKCSPIQSSNGPDVKNRAKYFEMRETRQCFQVSINALLPVAKTEAELVEKKKIGMTQQRFLLPTGRALKPRWGVTLKDQEAHFILLAPSVGVVVYIIPRGYCSWL